MAANKFTFYIIKLYQGRQTYMYVGRPFCSAYKLFFGQQTFYLRDGPAAPRHK